MQPGKEKGERGSDMNTDERIIELLQEQNRLLSILVAPIVSLQSKQLARATPEDRRKASKEALAAAKKAYKERNK